MCVCMFRILLHQDISVFSSPRGSFIFLLSLGVRRHDLVLILLFRAVISSLMTCSAVSERLSVITHCMFGCLFIIRCFFSLTAVLLKTSFCFNHIYCSLNKLSKYLRNFFFNILRIYKHTHPNTNTHGQHSNQQVCIVLSFI